jgi:hypothetical protein
VANAITNTHARAAGLGTKVTIVLLRLLISFLIIVIASALYTHPYSL